MNPWEEDYGLAPPQSAAKLPWEEDYGLAPHASAPATQKPGLAAQLLDLLHPRHGMRAAVDLLGGVPDQERGATVAQLRAAEEGRGPMPSQEAVAPVLERTTEAATRGGIDAAAGAIFSKIFATRPGVNLSASMRAQAKELEKSFVGKLAETVSKKGRGLKSPEAKDLWRRSYVVEEIEKAVARARGNPYRLAASFQQLGSNSRMQGRLTAEQLALIDDVAAASNSAGMLRALGDLRASLGGVALGGFSPMAGAGVTALSQGGRVIAGPATRRLADKALAQISGMPVAAPSPSLTAGAGAVATAEAVQQGYRRETGGVGPPAPRPAAGAEIIRRRW